MQIETLIYLFCDSFVFNFNLPQLNRMAIYQIIEIRKFIWLVKYEYNKTHNAMTILQKNETIINYNHNILAINLWVVELIFNKTYQYHVNEWITVEKIYLPKKASYFYFFFLYNLLHYWILILIIIASKKVNHTWALQWQN